MTYIKMDKIRKGVVVGSTVPKLAAGSIALK
jgi:hypothetical protein